MSTLYIFGSGASKCAGLPTTQNFLETVINEKLASSIVDIEDTTRLKGPYSIPKDFHKPFIERYERFIKETSKANIEEYLIWHKKTFQNDYDKELMWVVNWYFFDRINHVSTIRYHQIFIEKVLKPTDEIFYFNYDLIIDKAFMICNFKPKNDALYDLTYVKNGLEYTLNKPMGAVNLHVMEEPYENKYKGNVFVANGYKEITYIKSLMKWFGIPEGDYDGVYKKCNEIVKKVDEIVSFGYSFPQTDDEELIKIFGDSDKEIELVCGKDFVAPWTNRIKYKNLNMTFERWILENAK